MSAGPGYVMRGIVAAAQAEPGKQFTVDELCRRAFPQALSVQKKHRVAVIRAMRSVAAQSDDFMIGRRWCRGRPGRSRLVLSFGAGEPPLIKRSNVR